MTIFSADRANRLFIRAARLAAVLALVLSGCAPSSWRQPAATPFVPSVIGTPFSGGLLSGPSNGQLPTAPAPKLDTACLLGVWQAADLSQALEASLARVGSGLALQQVEGQALYEFTEGGGMKLTFQHLVATLAGQVDGREMTATQTLDGAGSARYTVDEASRQVQLSDFGGAGIRFALDINGQRLAEGSLPVWSMFATGQPVAENQVRSSRWSADCGGDTLELRAIDPVAGPEVQLRRVR